eukprot:scaffold42611_cov64-Phaeocystis_antarctica.AAC.2
MTKSPLRRKRCAPMRETAAQRLQPSNSPRQRQITSAPGRPPASANVWQIGRCVLVGAGHTGLVFHMAARRWATRA